MRQVEDRLGQPLRAYLDHAYNGRGLSMAQIGAEVGVDKATVSRWMRDLGVIGIRYVGYRRPTSESELRVLDGNR